MKKTSILIVKISVVLFLAFVWIDYFGYSKRIKKSTFEYESNTEQDIEPSNDLSIFDRNGNTFIPNYITDYRTSREINTLGSNEYNSNLIESNVIKEDQQESNNEDYSEFNSVNYEHNAKELVVIDNFEFEKFGTQQLYTIKNNSIALNNHTANSISNSSQNQFKKPSPVGDGSRAINMGDFSNGIDGARKYDEGSNIELQGPPLPPPRNIPLDNGVIALLFACITGAGRFLIGRKN